jgi:hypothetical protein
MNLIIGKRYRKRQDLTDGCMPVKNLKSMSFGVESGIFMGYTKGNMPRFSLNDKGMECFINMTDECFEEISK